MPYTLGCCFFGQPEHGSSEAALDDCSGEKQIRMGWFRPPGFQDDRDPTTYRCPSGYETIGLRCIGPCGGYWCKPKTSFSLGDFGTPLSSIPTSVWVGLAALLGLSIWLYRRRGTALSGLLIRADGTEEVYKPSRKKFSLEELQHAVGGYIELVPVKLGGRKKLWVNEEGKMMGLPINRKATQIVVENGFPDTIVGDVLITEPGEG